MTEAERLRLDQLTMAVERLEEHMATLQRDHDRTVIRTFTLKAIAGWGEGQAAPIESDYDRERLKEKIARWCEACDIPFQWDDETLYQRIVDKEREDRALEALIVMALRFGEDREITEEDIVEENLPTLTKEELEYFRKKDSETLTKILDRISPKTQAPEQGGSDGQ